MTSLHTSMLSEQMLQSPSIWSRSEAMKRKEKQDEPRLEREANPDYFLESRSVCDVKPGDIVSIKGRPCHIDVVNRSRSGWYKDGTPILDTDDS